MTFFPESEALLRDWCDGLLRQQIDEPNDSARHGAFTCPACGFLHGRCGDAVLPLLTMAQRSGEERYLRAALAVAGWMRNVDAPDGAWTNEVDPGSWKGITVFGAIARAEALAWHGDLLDEATRAAWRERLRQAGEFILRTFTCEYGNINYAAAGSHGLALLGRLLEEPDFGRRARELAHGVLGYLTPGGRLLHGEGRPSDRRTSGRRSAKGCYAVDLGYNVEESLPALLAYAELTSDDEVGAAAEESFTRHLAFMLPDGGWDNSWGTRNYKWSYWGSRTADGCQPALLRLARRRPLFATAAWRNLRLLRSCTHEGLLHGGPHLAAHGVPPCVHHTFCHAKALAAALRFEGEALEFDLSRPLWREHTAGLVAWPDIATMTAAHGPWLATVTGYDWRYRPEVFHATGGALSMLWHRQVGLICAASLARYVMTEAHNMQPNPDGEDFCLTPRVELRLGDAWYSNVFSLSSALREGRGPGGLEVQAEAPLVDAEQNAPPTGTAVATLHYRFERARFTMTARLSGEEALPWSLVLPIVSAGDEPVRWLGPRRVAIDKPAGTLLIEANAPLLRLPSRRERVFSPVGGVQAVPLAAEADGHGELMITITID